MRSRGVGVACLSAVLIAGCTPGAVGDALREAARADETTVPVTATVPATTTTTVYQPEAYHRVYEARLHTQDQPYDLVLRLSDLIPADGIDLSKCKGVQPARARLVQFELSTFNAGTATIRRGSLKLQSGTGVKFLGRYENGETCDSISSGDIGSLEPKDISSVDGYIVLVDYISSKYPTGNPATKPTLKVTANGAVVAFTGPGLDPAAAAADRQQLPVINPSAPPPP